MSGGGRGVGRVRLTRYMVAVLGCFISYKLIWRKPELNIKLLFSRSVMSDSLRLHGLQHARPLCLSPSPGACQSSCLLRW